jgi:hypothetical protein
MGNGGLYRLCPKSLPLDELVCRWSPEAVCQTWSEGLLDGTSAWVHGRERSVLADDP